MNPGRSVGLVLALNLAVILVLSGCKDGKGPAGPPSVPVVTAVATQKTLPLEVSAFGHAEAFRSVAVRAQVTGILERVAFTEGDRVQAGQTIFTIDAAPFQAALASAQANLARDAATAANLAAKMERYAALLQKDYVAVQENADLESQLASARASASADSAAVTLARLNLAYCTIAAPIAGRIGETLVDAGNLVSAGGASPLAVIHQIRPIYVRFSVPEQALPDILAQSADGTLAVRATAPSETDVMREGKLTFIDNAVDTSTGTILLKAEFPNTDDSLWPGEFLNTVLVLRQLAGVVTVPAQAIDTGQNGDYLFVVNDDATVAVRPVTVSRRVGNDAIIADGVQVGEKVVTDGQLRLRPGSKIVEKDAVGTSGANPS